MKKSMIALCSAVLLASSSALATVDTIVEYPNGATAIVPEGWKVEIVPEGFNTAPFNLETNIGGKLGGFQGWPLLKVLCDQFTTGGRLPTACINTPELILPDSEEEPEYDPLDTDQDGVVDSGIYEGCSYDIYASFSAGGSRYEC